MIWGWTHTWRIGANLYAFALLVDIDDDSIPVYAIQRTITL